MAATHVNEEAKTKFQDTRQLLDELDALMDQMLALPINEQAELDASDLPPPSTVVSATLTMLDPPPAATPLDEPIAQQSVDDVDDPSSADPSASYKTPLEPSAPAEATLPTPVLADVAAPAKVELLPLPDPIASVRWRPDHISYQFLLWINQGYDGGTHWLGKPGKLLRSRAAKALLGFAGLGLLGLAMAWLTKDWLGWN